MKTVLITGANRGIGLEFCRQYLHSGWKVIACCRNIENAHTSELFEMQNSQKGELHIERIDLLEHATIDTLSQKYSDIAVDLLI